MWVAVLRSAMNPKLLRCCALVWALGLLGMWLGQAIRKRVSPQTFRRWFLICLLLLGTELVLRPFV